MKYIGTRSPVDEATLDEWMRKLNSYASRAKERTGSARDAIRRFFSHDAKYGLDGIKRRSKYNEAPKPFTGAANNAIQWGDVALDTELSMAMETYRLAQRVVAPIAGGGASAADRSHKLSLLLNWALNHMDDFESQCKLALKYMLSSSPGCALVAIGWHKRAVYGPKRITRLDLMEALSAVLPEDFSAATLVDIVERGDIIPFDQVISVVQSITGADEKMCAKIIDALLDEDEVEYPGIVGVNEGPSIKALEFGTDFILPDYCTDFDLCELWCRTEWVNEAQLRDLASSNDWSNAFVEATLEHGGKHISHELDDPTIDTELLKDLYHLCYIYTAEPNESGIITRYCTVVSAAPGITACGKELLRGRRGRYPAIFIQRERLTENITVSRGLSEMASPIIDLAKKLADAGSNNALVGALPPVISKGNDTKLTLKPLKVIDVRPSSEVKFLQPPAFPAQAANELERLKDELSERVGLQTKSSDPNAITVRKRDRMSDIVQFLRQLLTGVLSITQANLSRKLLADILGESKADPALLYDVDGAYQVTLKVNVDELDRESIVTKLQTLGNIIPVLDRRLEADTTPILRHAMRLLFPTEADDVLNNVTVGSAAEVKDERNNFVQIKSGLQPQMNAEGGWNYEVRLNVWQEILQTNPNIMADWTPEAQQFAQQWIQALQHLAQQYSTNAAIGKTGSTSVQPMR